MAITKDLGMVTAYAYAVAGGYTGTEAEFQQLLANLAITLDEFENFSVVVNTLPAGSTATASYADGVLTLGIPKGDTGETGPQGPQGVKGDTGATPALSIGTVTTLPAGSDATASFGGTAEEPVLNLGLPEGADGDVAATNIAAAYDATKTYAVGDYVWYAGALYRCTTAITTAESWTAAHWTQVALADDVSDLKSDLTVYYDDLSKTGIVSEANTTFFEMSENLFNANTSLENTRLTTTGGTQSANAYGTSDWIDVTKYTSIKIYTFSNGTLSKPSFEYVLYDKFRKPLANKVQATGGTSVDTTTAVFLRVSFSYNQNAVYMIIADGYVPTSYIPYKATFKYTKPIHVGAGQQYTTLKAGFEAMKEGDTLIVHSGTYDLYTEFGGDDFFNSYSSASPHGLYLKNDCKYIFSTNATVKFDYTGGNSSVYTRFSPLNCLSNQGCGSFELIGCHIIAKGCRYCVHDDLSGYDLPNTHKYEGCVFELDNSANTNWKSAQCIGGGFSKNSLIEIASCVFNGTVHSTFSGTNFECTWHNQQSANTKSFLAIHDCYFKQGSISVRYYGNSELLSSCLVSNNSVRSAIDMRAESASGSPIENIDLMAWNNEIRAV